MPIISDNKKFPLSFFQKEKTPFFLRSFNSDILILPIVFTFAELGKKYPHAGGTAYFVLLAFGDKAARIVSWLFIWVVGLGAPVIVITGSNFLVNGLSAAGVIEPPTQQILFLCSMLMLFLLMLVMNIIK